MSCGTIPFVSNEAFKNILTPINNLLYVEKDRLNTDNIKEIINMDNSLRLELRKYVENKHSLDSLVKEIKDLFL